MSTDLLAVAQGTAASPGGAGLLVLPGREFADTLSLGQIIKGRVLRHFEGGRYLVNFGGRNKVVDSAVALKTDEILFGRVIGLGEQVELERVGNVREQLARVAANGDELPEEPAPAPSNRLEQLLHGHLQQHRVRMGEPELAALKAALRGEENPAPLIFAAIALHKLGISPTDELLRILFAPISRKSAPLFPGLTDKAIELASQRLGDAGGAPPERIDGNAAFVAALSGWLRNRAIEVPALGSHVRSAGRKAGEGAIEDDARASVAQPRADAQVHPDLRQDPIAIGHLLLNAQSGGSVSHRIHSLPLLIDGQLVELDIAFFDQRAADPSAQERSYRQVVFSLKTVNLGVLEINVSMVGDHMRVVVVSESSQVTQEMALHAAPLWEGLGVHGWTIDELRYETKVEAGPHAVAQSVLEHLIARDSLDRMV